MIEGHRIPRRFKRDAEGKAGAGLEKKQEKTGGQNVPAIEDTRAQRRRHRYHSPVSLGVTVHQLEFIFAIAFRAVSRCVSIDFSIGLRLRF